MKVFRDDGMLLYDYHVTGGDPLVLDVANPSGYLAGLLASDVDIYLEGVSANTDLRVEASYSGGGWIGDGADIVHMTVVDVSVDVAGGSMPDVVPGLVPEDIAAAVHQPIGMTDDAFWNYFNTQLAAGRFTLHFNALGPELATHVRVENTEAEEWYSDTLLYSGVSAHSAVPSVLYDRRSGSSPLSSAERDAFFLIFGAEVLANGEVVAKLSTPHDQQSWQLPTVEREHEQVAFVAEVEQPVDFSDIGLPFEHRSASTLSQQAAVSSTAATSEDDALTYQAAPAEAPDDPLLTQEQLVLYFKAIYGERGEMLLRAYQSAEDPEGNRIGHMVFLYDYGEGDETLGEISSAIWDPRPIEIRINKRANPALAAQELQKHLLTALGRGRSRIQHYLVEHHLGQIDIQDWQEGTRLAYAEAAQIAATMAELYLEGVTLYLGSGADLVMTVNDLSEGNYAGIAQMIPLVGPALSKSGGSLLIRKGDGVVGRLDESLIRRIWKEVGCFVAGTPVATESGRRSIDSICAGERVWAYDPNSKRWTLEPVVQPLTREYTGDFVTVGVEGGSPVTATGNHPFWVVEGDALDGRPEPGDVPAEERQVQGGRWVEARHLLIGDRLCLRSGSTVRVDRLDVEYGCRIVYNLHVERIHSYAVGEQSILAHNNTDECARIIEMTVRGGQRAVHHSGEAYEKWVRSRFNAASEATDLVDDSFIRRGGSGRMDRVVSTGGGTAADFDAFLPDHWMECKSGFDESIADIKDQLGKGWSVAKSHGKKYSLVTSAEVPEEILKFCRSKGRSINIIQLSDYLE